jgi:hypothetical protein
VDAHFGGVLFYSDVYIDAILKVAGGFSIGAQTAVDTWTEKMGVSGTTGNITTNGTITAAGNITGSVGSFIYIVCRGTTGRPIIPTAVGALLGADGHGAYCALELCANIGCYVDFATPNIVFTGRLMFNHAAASFLLAYREHLYD